MEFMACLAPPAFVFALVALSQLIALRKEVKQLKEQIAELRKAFSPEA